ncbi:MAG TPA: gephyrin-like molybdotransferase Glp [Chthoniobacterales bacterium]
MISEAEALAAVLAKVIPRPAESRQLIDSLGKFSAEEIFAARPLPAFDNSAMDGYAVQSASTRLGARLRVIGEQPAGPDRGLTIAAGEAIRIFTGAPIPRGADAVIMQEEVAREGDWITTQAAPEAGEFVRRRGADLAEGQKILGRGEEIRSVTLSLLASQGRAEIRVGGTPRVAIVSTGDELAQPGETLQPGQIFESNAILLHALALGAGAQIAMVENAPDDLARLTNTFRRGLEADALLVSGGVSVGDHDLVKPALRALGAEIDLWRVAIKPGKPFLFGSVGACRVFGLPGNPVSAFVTFLQFVRPALRAMAGADPEELGLREVPARLASEVANTGDRPHYFRGTLRAGTFALMGRQESHALFGLSRANALLRVAPGVTLPADMTVQVEIWD